LVIESFQKQLLAFADELGLKNSPAPISCYFDLLQAFPSSAEIKRLFAAGHCGVFPPLKLCYWLSVLSLSRNPSNGLGLRPPEHSLR